MNGQIIRALFEIELNRIPTGSLAELIPGPYYLQDKTGIEISFDFLQFRVWLNPYHPNRINFETTIPDLISFSDMTVIPERIPNIIAFPECDFYTEEIDLNPIKMNRFLLETTSRDKIICPNDTEYLHFEVINSKTSHNDVLQCHFKDKLLNTIVFA